MLGWLLARSIRAPFVAIAGGSIRPSMWRATMRSTVQMAARHCARPICSGIRPLPSAQAPVPTFRTPFSATPRIPQQPRIGTTHGIYFTCDEAIRDLRTSPPSQQPR